MIGAHCWVLGVICIICGLSFFSCPYHVFPAVHLMPYMRTRLVPDFLSIVIMITIVTISSSSS